LGLYDKITTLLKIGRVKDFSQIGLQVSGLNEVSQQ
jgi:hypothetical protein